MTTKEILLAAAEYIEKHGWQQYQYGGRYRHGYFLDGQYRHEHFAATGDGPACLAGAIGSVTGKPPNLDGDVLRAVDTVIGGRFIVSHWNDAPGRTKEEVIAALRAAAETVEDA